LRSFVAGLLDLVFPRDAACLLCGGEGYPLCSRCMDALTGDAGAYRCRRCGRFSTYALELCKSCAERTPAFRLARAVGPYGRRLRRAICLLKYERRIELAGPLGELLAEAARRELPRPDVVVPVPMHPVRLGERGFNQSQLLAERLARVLGLRLSTGSLVRVTHGQPQASLGASDRRKNVSDAFAVLDGSFEGRSALLVDDVMTSGATADACSGSMLRAGAVRVDVVVLASAVSW